MDNDSLPELRNRVSQLVRHRHLDMRRNVAVRQVCLDLCNQDGERMKTLLRAKRDLLRELDAAAGGSLDA